MTSSDDVQAPEAAPDVGLAAGAERLRSAAKWLVVSAGGVATVVFAGISISSVKGVEGGRLAVALVAAGIAIAGIILALVTTMSLAAASTITVRELKQPLDEVNSGPLKAAIRATGADPALGPWSGSFAAFVAACASARNEHAELQQMWVDDLAVDAEDTFVRRAALRFTDLEQTLQRLLEGASYVRLQQSFRSARWKMLGCLMLAGVGIVAFVWAVSTTANKRVPTISADFKNENGQLVLTARVEASDLSAKKHVQIRVYDAIASRTDGTPTFSADIGPDASGQVAKTISLPMNPNATHLAVLKVWVDGTEPDCSLAAQTQRRSCLVLEMPPQPSRPQLSASVAGGMVKIHVRAAALTSDQVVALNVYGASSRKPYQPLYRAVLPASASGAIDEALSVRAPAGFDTICVAARSVTANSYSQPTCPPPIDPDVAWAQSYQLVATS